MGSKSCGGFTLVELLVALSVMALMAVMAWQGLDAMARASTQVQERNAKVAVLNVGLQQWAQDLDMMVQTPPLSIMDWDGRVLRLVRRSTASASDGMLVAAWTRGERGGQGQWLRWQSEPLTTKAQLVSAFEQAGVWGQSPGEALRKQEVAIESVQAWQIYFHQGGAWSNPLSGDSPMGEGRATAYTTDSTASTGSAIDGIRLVLTLPASHPIGGTLTRDWVRPTLSGGES